MGTGRNLFRFSKSSVGFFRIGVIRANFSGSVTTPDSKDRFTMDVITVSSLSRHSLTTEVGRGSNELVLVGECPMNDGTNKLSRSEFK